jgi:hypothetical protein
MISLHDLQQQFYDAVFERASESKALATISESINASSGLSPSEHFSIYRGSIRAAFNRALKEIHPVCYRLVGEEFFNGMGLEYARSNPSKSADFAEYGADFADFIQSFPPASELVYLPDVARLEHAWHLAFNAADEKGFDINLLEGLQEKDNANLVFQLPVSATLLASDYPIHRIWQVNQEDFKGKQNIDLEEGGIKLIVWRRDYDMRVDLLSMEEWKLLEAIQQQKQFTELCELEIKLDSLLPYCVQQGWITSFRKAG